MRKLARRAAVAVSAVSLAAGLAIAPVPSLVSEEHEGHPHITLEDANTANADWWFNLQKQCHNDHYDFWVLYYWADYVKHWTTSTGAHYHQYRYVPLSSNQFALHYHTTRCYY